MTARNIRLVLEYDGTELSGWQRQANAPTVQQHLETALAKMVADDVTTTGASRTDAGVHARGQVANFHTDRNIPLHGFRRGLNGLLPPAISVVAAAEVPHAFHARFWARGKHYRYRLCTLPDRAPLAARTSWHLPHPLNVDAMHSAAAHMVGERADILHIDVWGTGFLRNMVRIVAGTLVAVGEGRIAAQEIPDVLASRQRDRAGVTAPARGLTLMRVYYDEPDLQQLHRRGRRRPAAEL